MNHNIERIAGLLAVSEKFSSSCIHYSQEIDSTNKWLLDQTRRGGRIDGKICIVESQSSGKGRRGKSWTAPASSSILMSIGWRVNKSSPQGLSLISGIAVIQSLQELGVTGALLKWPNDVIASGKKLGGVLVEISGLDCVIGIGINVNIPPSLNMNVGQPWTDLHSLGFRVDRDQLVAAIVLNHERLLSHYMLNGFAPFMESWNSLHAYQNQAIEILSELGSQSGTALGVDENGALMVECDGSIQRIISGEVSIRSSG